MTNTLKTEVVVIGAGPGGYVAAIRAAQLGMKTVLIEENKLGGICLNYGCIPSKAMIYASDFLNKIKKSSVMGISVKNPTLDFTKMQQWKEGIVTKLNKGVETLCKNNKIGVIHGRASFETSNKLKLENNNKITSIEFKKAIVATGSKPIEIPNLKFDEKTILSSTGALYLKKIPKSLAVVGGGYIGLELGTVYAKLGSKVTIIEMTDQLLPGFEKRVVDILHKNLEKMNVSIYLNTKAEKYENGKLIAASKEKGKVEITADAVLVAVGRYPNTKALGLENTKASLDDKGFFKVDKNLRTTDENIYAIGDVSIGPMLAHKASYQGKHVAEVISGEKNFFNMNF